MRNIAHMKKFVEPATIEIGGSKGPEEPVLPKPVVAPVQCDHPETKASQSSVQPPEVLPTNSPRSSDTSRPTRIGHKPAWMKDFVCNQSTRQRKRHCFFRVFIVHINTISFRISEGEMYCAGNGIYWRYIYYGIEEQKKRSKNSTARINTCCYEHEFLSFCRIDATTM